MRVNFSGQQALSRKYVQQQRKSSVKSASVNPLKFLVEYETLQQPFKQAIAGLVGSGPTIGPCEYFDKDNDHYLSERWPAHVAISGWVDFPDDEINAHEALMLMRKLLWLDHGEETPILPDQRSMVLGYRREFFHIRSTDILGRPRPSSDTTFYPTDIGEPNGPGLVTFDNPLNENLDNEFVWSEVLKFPIRTNFETDKDNIKVLVDARIRRSNSHSELRDSRRYVEASDRKAAVRAAASAVDACLAHCIEVNFLTMPPDRALGGFDKKIAKALELAGLPPFTQLEPSHARNILYLYRARSKMHEGDCYYRDESGIRVSLLHIDQVKPLVDSAHAFVLWMDTVL